jgi:hypothetical protein
MWRYMIADLAKNREIGRGCPGLFVLHFLLSGSFIENLPAHFSASYGMAVKLSKVWDVAF